VTSFIALYHGRTIGEAKMIGVSADAGLVSDVAARLLKTGEMQHDINADDPVIAALESGREGALRLIAGGEGESS